MFLILPVLGDEVDRCPDNASQERQAEDETEDPEDDEVFQLHDGLQIYRFNFFHDPIGHTGDKTGLGLQVLKEVRLVRFRKLVRVIPKMFHCSTDGLNQFEKFVQFRIQAVNRSFHAIHGFGDAHLRLLYLCFH